MSILGSKAAQAGRTPSQPTSVTASAGNAQATVSFTPGYAGKGNAVYTATSSPGGFTASGASSPLIVTGLSNGTAYTFTVTASAGGISGVASSASSAVTPAVPSIYTTEGATFRLKMPFNNSSGISDLSSNAYSFTNNNCSISSSQSKFYGQSLSVPNTGGVSSSQINRIYGSAPNIWQPILNSTTTFYTSAWVYITGTPDTWGTYLWGADVGGTPNGAFLAFNPNRSISVGWQDNVNSAANAVSLNTWTHVLWSFKASGKVHKLYINGNAVATVNNQNIFYANSQDKFHVGIRDNNINVSQVGFFIQDLVIMTGASIDNNFTVPGALV